MDTPENHKQTTGQRVQRLRTRDQPVRRGICVRRETLQRITGPLSIMYGSMEESTPAAEAPALGPADCRCRRLRRHRRIAPRRARALASMNLVSTSTVALAAARGHVRPDIPTLVSSSSIRRRSRRRIQISSLHAANSIAATRAACRRMGPRWRWPLDNLYCITCITT